jgi:serine/threonine protein kinase
VDANRFRRLVEIVGDAIERPAAERRAFVKQACGDDADLAAEAASLLAESEATSLDAMTARIGAGVVRAAASLENARVPERIGSYRIRGVLGEGGMGVVYHAEQEQPIRRDVALKVVRVGLVGASARARFESERQALAVMDHPGIARIYDAGATDDGTPYFAMEHITGESITAWSDSRQLDIDARLVLMEKVCHAVQHAHIKGVVHRDLKPSNILVTEVDGRAEPRLLDFGIAKAIESSGDSETMHTAFGAVMGTIEYMSPEQATGGAARVDTRSDIYSLGVILYELVTGTLPFESSALRDAGAFEALRLIRDTDPPTPERRFTGTPTRDDVARRRRTDVRSLRRQLGSDLGWIIMRALEKDPARRYQSAGDLADDLRRLRRSEPVAAGPPGRRYRVSRFVRRHRVGVVAASVVLVALLGGVTLATVGFVRAKRAQTRAEAEARRATVIAEFLTGMLAQARPENARGRDITVQEVVDSTAARVQRDRTFDNDPETLASILHALGETYRSLAQYDRALPLFERALEIREDVLGPENDFTLNSMGKVAATRAQAGDPRGSIEMVKELIRLRRKVSGPEHPDYVGEVMNLGNMYADLGEYDRAIPLLQEVIEIDRRTVGSDAPDIAYSINNLATVLVDQGEYVQAIPLHEESLALRRKHFGEPSAEVATALGNYARALDGAGRHDEALAAAQSAVSMSDSVFGPEHPRSATSRVRLGEALLHTGHAAEAEPVLKRALDVFLRVDPRHWRAGDAQARLGEVELALGKTTVGVTDLATGWDILTGTVDSNSLRCRAIAEILADHYAKTPERALADRWRLRAAGGSGE